MTVARPPILDRTVIGRRSDPQTVTIETGQLRFFAKATDQRDPIYFDEDAAKAAGYRGLPAPPTFAYSLLLAVPDQVRMALECVGADMRYILHAEQGFRNHGMMFGGDQITLTTEILDLYERKGGALFFIVQRTRLANQFAEVCAEANTTFVLRTPKV